MADVFISYKKEDRSHVERLVRALDLAGFSSWWDNRLTPLESWDSTIEREIAAAKAVIVLWSARAAASDWVRSEADFGKCAGKLVPIVIEECQIPLSFRLVQAARLVGWDGNSGDEQWQKVLGWLDLLVTGADNENSNSSPLQARDEDPSFSKCIRDCMEQTNRTVDRLTREQFDVLRLLGQTRRIRISGCAGSGKTLVACEKAVRCADAGLRTLVLCHSPNLARAMRRLVGKSPVEVFSFVEWLEHILARANDRTKQWTNLDEPDEATIEAAFDIMLAANKFDSVIVDEAQDFRESWWILVEAALLSATSSHLYIFHDDNQALLPYRASYPFNDPIANLSRNCRNAGRIFELVQQVHPQAPGVDAALRESGVVSVYRAEPGQEKEALCWVLEDMTARSSIVGEAVVLLAGGLEHSELRHMKLAKTKAVGAKWQQAVRDHFSKTLTHRDRQGISASAQTVSDVFDKLQRLSRTPYPGQDDIALVVEAASSIGIDPQVLRAAADRKNRLEWKLTDGELLIRRLDGERTSNAEILAFFRTSNWVRDLPSQSQWHMTEEADDAANEDALAMHDIGGFKGLEADTVVLVAGSRMPISQAEFYVALSRARVSLTIIDCGAKLPLPQQKRDWKYSVYKTVAV